MDPVYNVGVSNRFALFQDEEDDPGDVILAASTRPEKSDKDGKKAKAVKGKGKETSQKAQQLAGKKAVVETPNKGDKVLSNRERPPRSNRGEGRRPLGSAGDSRGEREREDRPPRGGGRGRPRLPSREKDKENESGYSGDRENRGEGRGPRGRPRGMGRGGIRGGGFTGGFRGKREFERRSGSDKSSVKAFDKREGGGAHNWGKAEELGGTDEWPNEETEAQQDPEATSAPNGEVSGEPKSAEEKVEKGGEEGEGEGEEKSEPVEEEPKEMTLDEYKATFSKKFEVVKSDSEQRRPGENEDLSQWKDTIVYERPDEEFFAGTREVIEKPKTSGRIKTTLEPHFYFKDPARRGRGRLPGGGRGGRAPEGREGFEGRDFEGGRRGGFEGGRDSEGGKRGGFDGGRRERDSEGGRRGGFEGGRRERDSEGGRRGGFEGGRRERDSEGGRRGGFEGGRRGRDSEGGRRGGFEGGRQERGEFEGGRRGGFGRYGKRERAPNVSDESDFPALSLNSP